MSTLTQFAADTYNCANSPDSSYGAGNFGTCEVLGTNTEAGVPNTGAATPLFGGASLDILLPLAVAVITVAASAVFTFKKRKQNKTEA